MKIIVILFVGMCMAGCHSKSPSIQPLKTEYTPGNTSGNQEGPKTAEKPCEQREKLKCNSSDGCAWYIDRCYDKPKEGAPHIPDKLANKRVTKVAVADGFCAIDDENLLWCVPKYSSIGTWIFPNSSQKFKQVAMVKDHTSDRICGTTIKGESVCFDSDKIKSGPANKNIVKTIPSNHFSKTVCAFDTDSNLFCDANEKFYEHDLPKFYESIRPPSMKLDDIYFRKIGQFDLGVYGKFSNQEVLHVKKVISAATGEPEWELGKSSLNHVSDISIYNSTICAVYSDVPQGLLCVDMDYGSQSDIPNSIKNNKVHKVATTKDFACVIREPDNELECWGKKKMLKNAPRALKGVKEVAVSDNLACYIDRDSKIGCFSDE